MKHTVFILLWLLPMLLWAQKESTVTLTPAESKARLQQLGDSLRQYDHFDWFDRHGWMVVNKATQTERKTDFLYGIINDKGQTILPCEYSCIRFQENSDLMMVARNPMSAGFMNRQLEWVIPPEYNEQPWCDLETDNYFSYGMTVVEKNGDLRYGVMDSLGNEILPCRYQFLRIATPDLFFVGEAGAINSHGDTVIPFIYNSLRFLEGRYIVAGKQNRYGIISTTGQEILPFVYESICDGDNGLFTVKQDGKYGVVDSAGNIVIPLKYETQHAWFIRGMDMVEMGGFWGGMDRDDPEKHQLLNKKGKVLVQSYDVSIPGESRKRIAVLFYDEEGNSAGEIYDRNGKKVDAFEELVFDGIDWINNVTMIPVKRNGKWGFVNRDFQLIVPCQYDDFVRGYEAYGNVNTDDGMTTLIDEKGRQLMSGPYYWISSPTVNGWYMVQSYRPNDWESGITGFIDRYGNSSFTEEEQRQIEQWRLKSRKPIRE